MNFCRLKKICKMKLYLRETNVLLLELFLHVRSKKKTAKYVNISWRVSA